MSRKKYKFRFHHNKDWPDGVYGIWVKSFWGWKWRGGLPIELYKNKRIEELRDLLIKRCELGLY